MTASLLASNFNIACLNFQNMVVQEGLSVFTELLKADCLIYLLAYTCFACIYIKLPVVFIVLCINTCMTSVCIGVINYWIKIKGHHRPDLMV